MRKISADILYENAYWKVDHGSYRFVLFPDGEVDRVIKLNIKDLTELRLCDITRFEDEQLVHELVDAVSTHYGEELDANETELNFYLDFGSECKCLCPVVDHYITEFDSHEVLTIEMDRCEDLHEYQDNLTIDGEKEWLHSINICIDETIAENEKYHYLYDKEDEIEDIKHYVRNLVGANSIMAMDFVKEFIHLRYLMHDQPFYEDISIDMMDIATRNLGVIDDSRIVILDYGLYS